MYLSDLRKRKVVAGETGRLRAHRYKIEAKFGEQDARRVPADSVDAIIPSQ